ncbi:hypothetical protein E2C01_066570 [Portunus trituberculatus]|uniref:Uncharacterized protein n=1 Tax=Portunus trituberculatus TaxID=210409 RepID=A0A5B7HHF9_PORTR|nr:hypothetical protein [Portunus trituberculatus]
MQGQMVSLDVPIDSHPPCLLDRSVIVSICGHLHRIRLGFPCAPGIRPGRAVNLTGTSDRYIFHTSPFTTSSNARPLSVCGSTVTLLTMNTDTRHAYHYSSGACGYIW